MIRALLGLLPETQRRRVPSYLVLLVLGVALRAAGAVLLVPLVRELFGDHPDNAWPWLGALAATTVVGWLVDAAVARRGFDLGFGLLEHAQHTVAERLTLVRLDWFSPDTTATARQAIAATGPSLVGLVIYLVTPILGAVLLPLLIALALLMVSWPLALAALGGVPLLLGAYYGATRITQTANQRTDETATALTERLVEFARTQATLRASRRVEPERSLAGTALAAQHGATMRLLLLQIPGQLLFSIASQVALLLLAVTTSALAAHGTISSPEAIALLVVIARYLEPFTALGELSGAVEASRLTLQHIKAVLDAPVVALGTGIASPAPAIELRNVSFGYAGSAPVLDDLDLRLEPGTTTAVVGPSGSGKSTLIGLLAGLHRPTGGQLLFDDQDLASLDASAVSVVFQHPYLFDGTVRDNVLAGHPDASAEQLAEAMSLARVTFADASVGEGGRSLSGGERQRVSIARALLKPAPVLLIDEATSALDTENEAAVVDALSSDPTPRTRVVVAHRLASIRTADRVLFLEDGRVVEDGPLDELLAAGGRLAAFWAQQEAASGWRITRQRPAPRTRRSTKVRVP